MPSAHIIAIVPLRSGWSVECSCGCYARREMRVEIGAWVAAHLPMDVEVAITPSDGIAAQVVEQVERRRGEDRR